MKSSCYDISTGSADIKLTDEQQVSFVEISVSSSYSTIYSNLDNTLTPYFFSYAQGLRWQRIRDNVLTMRLDLRVILFSRLPLNLSTLGSLTNEDISWKSLSYADWENQ